MLPGLLRQPVQILLWMKRILTASSLEEVLAT
jgi:hypothetical protein